VVCDQIPKLANVVLEELRAECHRNLGGVLSHSGLSNPRRIEAAGPMTVKVTRESH
jgi:hypothetical protein